MSSSPSSSFFCHLLDGFDFQIVCLTTTINDEFHYKTFTQSVAHRARVGIIPRTVHTFAHAPAHTNRTTHHVELQSHFWLSLYNVPIASVINQSWWKMAWQKRCPRKRADTIKVYMHLKPQNWEQTWKRQNCTNNCLISSDHHFHHRQWYVGYVFFVIFISQIYVTCVSCVYSFIPNHSQNVYDSLQ